MRNKRQKRRSQVNTRGRNHKRTANAPNELRTNKRTRGRSHQRTAQTLNASFERTQTTWGTHSPKHHVKDCRLGLGSPWDLSSSTSASVGRSFFHRDKRLVPGLNNILPSVRAPSFRLSKEVEGRQIWRVLVQWWVWNNGTRR